MGGRRGKDRVRPAVIGALAGFVALAIAPAAGGAAAAGAAAVGPVAHAAQVGGVVGSEALQLVLPLSADYAGLKRRALAVTTPRSPEYGQYESIAALSREFGASAATRRQVVAYLSRQGATGVRVDATGLFVDATLSAARAEQLFATPLARFRAAHNVRFIAPTAAVNVPAPLRGLVTSVVGLDTRPLFGSSRLGAGRAAFGSAGGTTRVLAHGAQAGSGYFPSTGSGSGCPGALGTHGFTPNQYLTAYDYDPLHNGGIAGQGERVALIEIDGFRYSDITTFASCFGLAVPAINGFGVGLSHPLPPGGESTLDLEVLDASAPKLKAIDVYESSSGAAEALRAMTAPLQHAGSKPQVISASLGLCEEAVVGTVGASGIDAVEASLQLAAASGITFLASSGDAGSADCLGSDGTPLDQLAVNYPASSWWVTGVGGTNFTLGATNQISNQFVWNDADMPAGSAGGGGFSAGFSRPSYQNGTVATNRRAVPDVSMLADIAPGYAIYCTATPDCVGPNSPNPWTNVGGTSAGTPLLAGGFALVDEELRLNGRQDLGLVNPLLYRLGRSSLRTQVFSDVVQGNNDVGPYIPSGGGRALGCCTAGPGYDEASGWGSVDLARFALQAIGLQPKIVSVGLSLPGGQRPVASHKVLATVSCSGPCLMGAAVKVTIGGKQAFVATSSINRLRSKGKKTISIGFSKSQLNKLRGALAAHKRIVGDVVGVVVDAGGNIEKQTRGQTLAIGG
jgi:subtilase family serine protease